jgi:patatin-like phospholipase/acyl hydrolase
MTTSQHRLHLLSLDGGGIRGLSSISILKHIMKGINADRQVGDKLQPWEVFDMIGGTSTGGLIAVMIGRLRMTLDQCEEAYLDLGKRIFQRKYNPVDIPHRLKNFWDAGEKFSGEELEAAIKEIITKGGHLPEDAPLMDDDSACKVSVYMHHLRGICLRSGQANVKISSFVCTVQASDSKAHALRSYETKIYDAQYPSCKIWEACRATSAATTFFDPIEIGSKRVKYIDGGIKSNNPISMVHFEASMIWPDRINDALVISIGTGSAPGPKFEGNIASIIKALREIVTASDDAANAFEDAHESMARSDLYFRFTVHQKLADIGLEEWDATGDVEAATASYMTLAETRRKCDRCIQKIIGED